MNMLIGAIAGALAALIFPYILRKLKINDETAKKINPILAVGAVIVSINLYGTYLTESIKEDKAKLNTAFQNFENLASGDTSVTTNQSTGDINANDASRGAYVLTEMTELNKPYVERVNALSLKLTEIATEGMLGRKLYEDENTLNSARYFITNYTKLLEEDLAIFDEVIAAETKFINALTLDKKFVSDMQGAFNNSSKVARELRVERIKASKKFVEKVKVMVQLAEKNFGKTKITDDSIDFLNEADNALYNKNWEELQQAASEENKAVQAQAENQTKTFNSLKKSIK